jgi:hypothetical protein
MAAPPSDSDTVPAVVDDALASAFQVGIGGHFSVNVDGYTNGQEMRFVVVAVVHHIPTIYSSPEENGFMSGLLADYSTFASVYKQDTGSAAPSPNMVWLRTKDDADSLASVRAAVNSSALALTNPRDRRQMLADQQGDPLQLNLVGTLLVGATTALALAADQLRRAARAGDDAAPDSECPAVGVRHRLPDLAGAWVPFRLAALERGAAGAGLRRRAGQLE